MEQAKKFFIVKSVTRVLGTLAGLYGVAMLCVTAFVLSCAFPRDLATGKPGLAVALLLIGVFLMVAFSVYLIYVAYVVLFRYSAPALRHLCAAIVVYAFTTCVPRVGAHSDEPDFLFAVIFFGGIVIANAIYRIASRYLCRWVFPDPQQSINVQL